MTEAGRALVDEWQDISEMWDLERRVLAIEQEARAEALRRAEAAVKRLTPPVDLPPDPRYLMGWFRPATLAVIRDTPEET